MRRIQVVAEFVFPLSIAPGKVCAEIECCATADVVPGSPARPWQDDPGSGPEVARYREVYIDCGGYSKEAGRYVPEWVEPDNDMFMRVMAWLYDGNADSAFEDAANEVGFGPDPDYLRELRAAQ